MKSGLYMRPGEPATCSAAVRAIWLARPGTSVSKVSAGLRRLRDGSAAVDGAPLAAAEASLRAAKSRASKACPFACPAACRGEATSLADATGRPAGKHRRALLATRTAFARGERDVDANRLAGELAQHRLDSPRVLVTDPVELEAVRDAQRHHRRRAL